MKPKMLIKEYKKTVMGSVYRKMTEKKLYSDGYFIYQEEELKKFNAGKGCLMLIIFFPLVFFCRDKWVKVTYQLKD